MDSSRNFLIVFTCIIFCLSCSQVDKEKESKGWNFHGYNPERTFNYPFPSNPVKNFSLIEKAFLPVYAGADLFSGDVDGDNSLELIGIDHGQCHIFEFNEDLSNPKSSRFDCLERAGFLKDINADGSEEIFTCNEFIDRFEIWVQDSKGNLLKKISVESKDILQIRLDFMLDRKIFGSISRNDGIGCRGVFCMDFDTGKIEWFYTVGPYIKNISIINKGKDNLSLSLDTFAPDNGKFGFGKSRYTDTITTDARIYSMIIGLDGNEEFVKQYEHRGHCFNFSSREKIFSLIYKPKPFFLGEYFINVIDTITDDIIWEGKGPAGEDITTGHPEPVIAKLDEKGNDSCRIAFSYPEAGVVSVFDLEQKEEKRISIPDKPFVFAINDVDGDGNEEILVLSKHSLHILNTALEEEFSITIEQEANTGIVSDLNSDGFNEVIISTTEGILIFSVSS